MSLFESIFAGDRVLAATSDQAWIRAMLRFEAALARASAAAGVIPERAAEEISSRCQTVELDPVALGRAGREGANPVIPLVAELRKQVGPESAGWVHFGATSQDTLDTALMLVAGAVLDLVLADLRELAAGAGALAARYRSTPMAARTLLQQAGPTTFGAKAAGWLVGALEASDVLARVRRTRLAVQLAGPAGTLAALGPAGLTIMERVAAELDLVVPVVPWPTDRTRVAELAGALGLAAGVAGKVAADVSLLTQTEVGEVREPAAPGRGGSSALPHKRNPALSTAVAANSRRVPALVQVVLGAMVQEHERSAGAWQSEWQTLTELFRAAAGAVAGAAQVVGGLEVDTEAMARNLDRTGGSILAERVTVELTGPLGYVEARRLVEEASRSGRPLPEALPPEAAELLPADVFDPAGWVGSAQALVDRALARAQQVQGMDAQTGQPSA